MSTVEGTAGVGGCVGCPGEGEEEEDMALSSRNAVPRDCFLFFCKVQLQFLLLVMQTKSLGQ